MIDRICSTEQCVGCALCESVCPTGAVAMSLQNGFWRPTVSASCVECGRCTDLCPACHRDAIRSPAPPETVYAAWAKDDAVHRRSTSGGLAYKLAESFIQRGGFAVGVWFDPDTQRVEHRLYDRPEDLSHMQGSKYVSSCKAGLYQKVLAALQEKDVLFIGVPCEVYAMKQALAHAPGTPPPHRLYTVDLLCRGGSSPQCLHEQLSHIARGKPLGNVTFRGGEYDCRFAAYDSSGSLLYLNAQYDDPYFGMFMKHIIFQKACFSCPFAGAGRQGDLTLSDFWGVAPEIKQQSGVRGINMVMLHSDAGRVLFDAIRPELVLFERSVAEAIAGNDTLREPTPEPAGYDEFWRRIREIGFLKATRRTFRLDCRKHPLRQLYRGAKRTAAKLLKRT